MPKQNQPQNPRQQFLCILDKTERYVRQQKEEGLASIEIAPQTVRDLGRLAEPPCSSGAVRRLGPTPQSGVATGGEPGTAPCSSGAVRRLGPTPQSVVATGGGDSSPDLAAIAARIAACKKCPLHETRRKTVPGQGSLQPDVAFVGEGPGADEDAQGLAFVGRAGQLLTKIIEAMGYTRDQVWIGNIVKCRPPENRVPMPDEMEACLPYLREQLALLKPKLIVCLGATAVKGLLGVQTGITRLRGTWMSFAGVDVMPTYHPAYLLRNPAGKKEVWDDMKAVLDHLGRKPPARKQPA